jgi:integrase
MEMTEIQEKYVTSLYNNPNITSQQTIDSYCSMFDKFTANNHRIYRLTESQLKLYMAEFRQTYSDSYYNGMGSVLKIIYGDVLNQPRKIRWFKTIKLKRKHKDIVSYDKFIDMMKRTPSLKQKTILILFYSTGIRLTELINIEISHIDWGNKRIFIDTLKGGKKRYVPIHNLTARYLRKYIKRYAPNGFLFNGQKTARYSASSIQQIFKMASSGSVSPHLFRHTFISNMVEKVDVFMTQELAGHLSLNSTLYYNHISANRMKDMYNPLDG